MSRQDKNKETTGDTNTALVSITDLLNTPQEVDDGDTIETLRIGGEAAFVAFFTDQAVPVSAHWLDATDTWNSGYVQCSGSDCPACMAGVERKDFLLLPVVDRLDGRVKLLRISTRKGAGKLLTELGPLLSADGRETSVVQITRDRSYNYAVSIQRQDEVDPEVAQAAQRFVQRMADETVDLTSSILQVPANEMATHEKIAKRLQLTGQI